MKRLVVPIVLLMAISLQGCWFAKKATVQRTPTPVPTSRDMPVLIDFENSFKAAMNKAKYTNKPLWIDFYTEACFPCKMMEKAVFVDYQVAKFYNKHFISLKIDGNSPEGRHLIKKYQISSYPTLLYLNNSGNVVNRYEGGIGSTAFIEEGRAALSICCGS